MTGLAEKTKYGFQVRAKRVGGAWGEFTLSVYQMTGALADPVMLVIPVMSEQRPQRLWVL